MTSQIIRFLILSVFFLQSLISCHEKRVSVSQPMNDSAQDERLEEITKLYSSGEYSDFIKLAEEEMKKSGKDFGLDLALSDAYGQIGDFEKAFLFGRKVLDSEPSNYYALLLLGNYHFSLERLDSAEYYYYKSLEINPGYARVYLNLAQLYEQQENKDKAVVQYLNAIELFKKNNFKDEVEFLSRKVLELAPDNSSAKSNLQKGMLIYRNE